jgi:predicted HTH transcriptional regulator
MKAEGPENGVYVRLGSTNRQADRELIAELRRTAEGIAFDELPMPELSIDDLDLLAVKSLFRGNRKLGEEELTT